MPWVLADRGVGALFMLAAAALLAWSPASRRARVAWLALLLPALVLGVWLNLQPGNCPSANFTHYYLGAKYPVPYADTYRLIRAGQGLPQLGYRDLSHPTELVRASDAEQRAYYLELLRSVRAKFDPLAPTEQLASLVRASGAVEAEAQRILAAHLPPDRVAAYRADVRAVQATGQAERLAFDYGYNGSPFYGLLRHIDPTLYLPYGRVPAWANLAWQLLGVALLAAVAGAALGYTLEQRLAVAALLLASADFTAYTLSGLAFTELWVPVAFAAWAVRRQRPTWAGLAIAVAGLLKLFPFVLLVPPALVLARAWRARQDDADAARARRGALLLLAACAAATLALGAASIATGRSWPDFAHKIAAEFHSDANMINSVSLAALLMTLGVPEDSPLLSLVALVALAALAAIFWRRDPSADADALPRRMLVLVAATGLLVKSWLNYYAVLPLVLLPLLARRHRAAAVAGALAMAVAYALPDFDDPRLVAQPWLHALKLLPYLAVPALLVWLELRPARRSVTTTRAAWALAALLVVGTAAESWRHHEVARRTALGLAALDAGDPQRAFEQLDACARLSRRDAFAQRKRAIALATLGRMDDALAGFARAVALAPDDAAARDDYARALGMRGQLGAAAEQLERAHALAPCDVQVLFALAQARAAQGRADDALALLLRARELAPGEPAIADAVRQVTGGR